MFVLALDDSFRWLASEALSAVYMKTWFPGANVEMWFLPSPTYVTLSSSSKLSFTEAGVERSELGGAKAIGYAHAVILHAVGRSVTTKASVTRGFVAEHNAEWRLSSEELVLP